MNHFLQVDDEIIKQSSHIAAKLNKLMNDYFCAKDEKQYLMVKKAVINFRFGTYKTNTIIQAFELFQVKDNAISKNIKNDFLMWMEESNNHARPNN